MLKLQFLTQYRSTCLCIRQPACKFFFHYRSPKSTFANISNNGSLHFFEKEYKTDEFTNVTPKILSRVGENLHNRNHHPLNLIRRRIEEQLQKITKFSVFDNVTPDVTTQQNFDSLLVPQDHVSRKKSDSYYINKNIMLRAHTTAHDASLLKAGERNFINIGDVYRRDEIDSTHYPVFHQLDCVRSFSSENLQMPIFERGEKTELKQDVHTLEAAKFVENDMKSVLEGVSKALFGENVQFRWVQDDVFFPFTHPSWELEVLYNDSWLELLGCGILQHEILQKAGADENICWAFGVGLERLAMKLYDIPDIRLFWSKDRGFLSQFEVDYHQDVKYKPISVYPASDKDMSMWLSPEISHHPNDFYDIVRSVGGDVIERVSLVDEYTAKDGRTSHCYRITYRSMEKTLTRTFINDIHKNIADQATKELGITVR